tara:strand:- start:59 stop:415 length:357 start_codon:yes stop_codon:yes gene_type:complete
LLVVVEQQVIVVTMAGMVVMEEALLVERHILQMVGHPEVQVAEEHKAQEDLLVMVVLVVHLGLVEWAETECPAVAEEDGLAVAEEDPIAPAEVEVVTHIQQSVVLWFILKEYDLDQVN